MAYIDHVTKDSTRHELMSKPVADAIAQEFSTSQAYAVGDCVFYETKLYRFTAAHTAGAWNSAHVSEVKVSNEINDLKDDLSNVETNLSVLNDSGLIPLEEHPLIQGSYNGQGEVVVRDSSIRTSGYIPVHKGEKITFAAGTKAAQILIGIFDTAKVWQREIAWQNDGAVIDVDADGYYIILFRTSSAKPPITPSDYDAITQIIPLWKSEIEETAEELEEEISNIEPGLSDDAKHAILNCFEQVAWIDGYGQNYYNALMEAFNIQTDPLDQIAYDSLTYRDIFITNNNFTIGDFEGDIPLSSTYQVLPNGDYYKINAGSPVITSEVADTGSKSLKSFGTGSTQILYFRETLDASALSDGKMLFALRVKTTRYVKGNSGVLASMAAVKNSQNLLPKIFDNVSVTNNEVSNDFVSCVVLSDLNLETINSGADYDIITLSVYLGTFSSANIDNYIDNVVISIVPASMDINTALSLYDEYIGILKNS